MFQCFILADFSPKCLTEQRNWTPRPFLDLRVTWCSRRRWRRGRGPPRLSRTRPRPACRPAGAGSAGTRTSHPPAARYRVECGRGPASLLIIKFYFMEFMLNIKCKNQSNDTVYNLTSNSRRCIEESVTCERFRLRLLKWSWKLNIIRVQNKIRITYCVQDFLSHCELCS